MNTRAFSLSTLSTMYSVGRWVKLVTRVKLVTLVKLVKLVTLVTLVKSVGRSQASD